MKIYYEGLACRLVIFLTKEGTFQNSWHCHFWLHKERSNETSVEWWSSHPKHIHFNYAFHKCSRITQIVQTVAVLKVQVKPCDRTNLWRLSKWIPISEYIPWAWFMLADEQTQYHNPQSSSLRQTVTSWDHKHPLRWNDCPILSHSLKMQCVMHSVQIFKTLIIDILMKYKNTYLNHKICNNEMDHLQHY